MILSFVIAFAVTILLGVFMIPYLRRLKFGQTILEDGPVWHMSKQGTPTMGGLMFIIGISAAVLIGGWGQMMSGQYSHIFMLLLSLGFGSIGFVDDFLKVVKKQNMGLTAPQKLALQFSFAALFLAAMRYSGHFTSNLFVPFLNVTIALPWVLYMVFIALAMVLTVNAVNFTDGVDGLLTSVTLPVGLFFMIVAVKWAAEGEMVFAAAICGGLCAFLIYNFNPAKVFMGDTGSLFLGGAVCAAAIALDIPLIILVVGLVYVIEILSVVIQVAYFKATGGKRIFRMTPIHHHFEMSGWSEKKVCAVFTVFTALLCLLAYVGVSARY